MTKALSIQDRQKALRDVVLKHKSTFVRVLPKGIDADRFIQVAVSAITKVPNLANCTQISFLQAIMQACQLGLEVNTPLGQATIIPYGKTATFMPMYGGLIELMTRSGLIKYVDSRAVYEGDTIEVQYGLEPNILHKPNIKGGRGELIGAYAIAHLENGVKIFEYMTAEDINKVKASSPSAHKADSPWQKHPESMWRKSPIKRLAKYMPKSTDEELRRFAEAVEIDNKVEQGEAIEIASSFVVDDDSDIIESEAPLNGESKSEKLARKLKNGNKGKGKAKDMGREIDEDAELAQRRTEVRNKLAKCVGRELCKEQEWLPAINQAGMDQLADITLELNKMLKQEG